jgi:hypothetical protein
MRLCVYICAVYVCTWVSRTQRGLAVYAPVLVRVYENAYVCENE